MESVKKLVVKLGLKQVALNSGPYRFYIHSAGSPFYLLHTLRWNFANLLTSRKKVSINGVKISLPVRNLVTHFRWFLIEKKEPEARDWVDEKISDNDVLYDRSFNGQTYYSDAEVDAKYPVGCPERIQSIVKAGTVILEDTRGLHRAVIPEKGYRDLGYAVFAPKAFYSNVNPPYLTINREVFSTLSTKSQQYIPFEFIR